MDAAIVNGIASLMTSFFGSYGAGIVTKSRGTNATDSRSHFYDVYECAGGKFVSLVPIIEAKFHAELLQRLKIDPAGVPKQWDKSGWAKIEALLAERFRSHMRDEWCQLLDGSDTCFAPVLTTAEAPKHPHLPPAVRLSNWTRPRTRPCIAIQSFSTRETQTAASCRI
jgi:crotonobetainyl-CoA:carnitine CoA-transferase CaiB-like acyl-CoA transferase